MANTLIQAATQASGSGATLARSVSATASNNMVVVHIGMRDLNETCTSVTDDKGNSYTLLGPIDQATNVRLYTAYGRQTVSGVTSITGNFSGSTSSKGICAEEYHTDVSGQVLTFDASTIGQGASDPIAVSTLTPAGTGELVVASVQNSGSVTFTAGAGFTSNNGASVFVNSEYKLSGAATETAPWTTSGTGNWAERAIAFKLTSASLIKTVNGLALASIKTFNGLAIASVKSINGLT